MDNLFLNHLYYIIILTRIKIFIQLLYLTIRFEMEEPITQISQNEEEIRYCDFCNKKAISKCSNCQTATYCSPEHQKADWPSHKRRCIHPAEKVNQLKKYIVSAKKAMFQKIAAESLLECQQICANMIQIMSEIIEKAPSQQNELKYGSFICAYIKILIKIKNFNEAQQVLNKYMKQKMSFLKDMRAIPSRKQNPEEFQKPEVIEFVTGKLKLISVIANLTHQLVRNSVYIVQILLKHCQKFYGYQSLEVANIYFYLGHYLYFMNQKSKALACFLVAGKIRDQDGLTCYFNAAKILMNQNRFHKAIKFFNKTLDILENSPNKHNDLLEYIYEGLSYCYKRLNHYDNTVMNLEKALCQIKNKKEFSHREKPVKNALKYLLYVMKKEFKDDENVTLPKERVKGQKQRMMTNKNLKDFWNKDNENSSEAKNSEWEASFKKQHDFMKFQSKIPLSNIYTEKFLFQNHFIEDKNNTGYPIPTGNSWINIDLRFMETLTAREVRFLDELNIQLMDCKDQSAAHSIFQNSKLLQALDQAKLNRFYQLNPKLIKTQTNPLFDLGDDDYSYPEKKLPKLDLTKVNNYK